jgi:hypothetical protein
MQNEFRRSGLTHPCKGVCLEQSTAEHSFSVHYGRRDCPNTPRPVQVQASQ